VLARSCRQNLAAAIRSGIVGLWLQPVGNFLVLSRLGVALALPVLTAAALTLAACGRNGPPLPPPGPQAQAAPAATAPPPGAAASPAAAATGTQAQQTAQKNGFDIFGNAVAPPGQKKSFLLDPLLQ
jgi:hypothetical protein